MRKRPNLGVLFGLIAMVALGVVLASPYVAGAQGLATQITGVWQVTSVVVRDLQTGAVSRTYGEKPAGRVVFTRGGNFTWVFVGDARTAPAGPVPTDAERIVLYNTLSFGTGTYRVDGGTVSLRYDSSWNQSWTGTERKANMEVSDKTLTWKSPPYKSLDDGKDVMAITTLQRLE